MRHALLVASLAACGPAPGPAADPTPDGVDSSTPTVEAATRVRLATFNASMYRSAAGELAEDLADPGNAQAQLLAALLQEVRPDVVLINEFDHDADGLAIDRFLGNFASVSQDGREALDYPHRYAPTVNTGVASGLDLDNDGVVETTPGSEAYGDDSFGFGTYPGQYGFVVLSRYPIDEAGVRTFQQFLWRDLPDALLPDDPATAEPADWYSAAELDAVRLSSKSHADVPVDVDGHVVHFLVSHPTPPSFDGDEDRNGRRNHDEIRFWVDYLDGGPSSYHVDDDGVSGALTDASFVVAGDLNNDPDDGDGLGDVTAALVAHPRATDAAAPRSEGGAEQAAAQGGRNDDHVGDPAEDTADFNDNSVGNLRVDYVVPSADLGVAGSGVFWPTADDPDFALVGEYPFPLSDHRLVWVDLDVP